MGKLAAAGAAADRLRRDAQQRRQIVDVKEWGQVRGFHKLSNKPSLGLFQYRCDWPACLFWGKVHAIDFLGAVLSRLTAADFGPTRREFQLRLPKPQKGGVIVLQMVAVLVPEIVQRQRFPTVFADDRMSVAMKCLARRDIPFRSSILIMVLRP